MKSDARSCRRAVTGQCRRCKTHRLQLESAGVRAAGTAGRRAGGGLEPADELLNGEGLGEGGAIARGASLGGGSRLVILDGSWGGDNDGGSGLGRSSRGDWGSSCGRGGWGSGSGSWAGGGTVPDSGSRNLVGGETVVDVAENTWVGGRVSLGHVGTGSGESGRS